jgi:Holliday junction resolvasome RuvABC DNA-binding subunit
VGADAVSALVNLGYSQRDAERAVREVAPEGAAGPHLADVIRLALRHLSR